MMPMGVFFSPTPSILFSSLFFMLRSLREAWIRITVGKTSASYIFLSFNISKCHQLNSVRSVGGQTKFDTAALQILKPVSESTCLLFLRRSDTECMTSASKCSCAQINSTWQRLSTSSRGQASWEAIRRSHLSTMNLKLLHLLQQSNTSTS